MALEGESCAITPCAPATRATNTNITNAASRFIARPQYPKIAARISINSTQTKFAQG
jgi:hypothetical protein